MKLFHRTQLERFSRIKKITIPRRGAGSSMPLRDVAIARYRHLSRYRDLWSARLPKLFGVACGLFAAGLLAMGCASTVGSPLLPIGAHGPKTVFPSVEAAAFDALSYSYLQSRAMRRPSRALGGSIYPVRGGFSYEEPIVAEKFSPDEVVYSLRRQDVAHFHTYPKHWDSRVNKARETLSKSDRTVVNSLDPLHRPSFILTPRLKVKVYRSEDEGTQYLAKLGDPSEARQFTIASAPPSVQSAPRANSISLNSEEASGSETILPSQSSEDPDDPG